jgi:hypothetical protein
MTPSTSLKSILSIRAIANIMVKYSEILLVLSLSLVKIEHVNYSLAKLIFILNKKEQLFLNDFWKPFESTPKNLSTLRTFPNFAKSEYSSEYQGHILNPPSPTESLYHPPLLY